MKGLYLVLENQVGKIIRGNVMVNDVIADSLTRIRNACLRKLEYTTLYYANIVIRILEIFKSEGFIKDFRIEMRNNHKVIVVILHYDEQPRSYFNEIKRVSKSSRRVYKSRNELRRFKNGYGIMVVSTSMGILSNVEAYNNNTGGEVLCSVW